MSGRKELAASNLLGLRPPAAPERPPAAPEQPEAPPPATAQPQQPARKPRRATERSFVEGQGRGRGRPAAAVEREQVMVYLRPATHERLSVGAKIAGRPMTHIVEELVEAWCARNEAAIDAAMAVLDPSKLRTKISIT